MNCSFTKVVDFRFQFEIWKFNVFKTDLFAKCKMFQRSLHTYNQYFSYSIRETFFATNKYSKYSTMVTL